jgi:cytochrome c55X
MPTKRSAMFVFVAACAFAIASFAAPGTIGDDVAAPAPTRQRELVRLLRQDCGACHGLRLTGGLGPALTPDALKDKAPANLAAAIVHGRAGTAMPPWRGFISDAEADWLVARLREGTTDAP